MNKEEVRLKCLEMATAKNPNPTDALAAAEWFYRFVYAEKKDSSPQDTVTEAVHHEPETVQEKKPVKKARITLESPK